MTLDKTLAVLIPVAYLAGSIPFGLLVGLAKGIDPRKVGSGNIGATNVGRLLGGRYFVLVFMLDLLKGLAPMIVPAVLLARSGHSPELRTYLLWLLIGAAAIIGHMFSLFLNFKGGKGVATSAGVALGVFPFYTAPAVVAIAVWVILFRLTRYVSIASIAAAALFPIAYLAIGLAVGWPVFHQQLPLLVFATLIAGMIIYKHRTNIARLRSGTENRISAHWNRA